jgi:hypothetical protein
MTLNYKVLGQSLTTAGIETDLYTVPASKETALSAITITNSSGSTTNTYKLSVVPSGQLNGSINKNYIAYNKSISPNQIDEIKGGITLSAGDKIKIFSPSSSLIVQVYGVEKS